MNFIRGKIDLDKLGEIIKADPALVDTVRLKDGSTHRVLKVMVSSRKEPSQSGSTHYLKVDTFKHVEVQNVNYYLADLYPVTLPSYATKAAPTQSTPSNPPAPAAPTPTDDLPF